MCVRNMHGKIIIKISPSIRGDLYMFSEKSIWTKTKFKQLYKKLENMQEK